MLEGCTLSSRATVFSARVLTTKCDNQQRLALIEDFRSNAFRIFLVSAQTTVTTHGIDLDHVRVVINYDLPCSLGANADLDYVTYHHRLDRCGRYDQAGYLVGTRFSSSPMASQSLSSSI